MLRLPTFELHEPTTIEEACAVLAQHGESAKVLAGGTDLLPNLKHEMYDVDHVVSLAKLPGITGFEMQGHDLVIGPLTPLAAVASDPNILKHAPALAQAAGLVAGPQHRLMGTAGGNVMLDTRCQWINQSYFWREALGFCMKKDGTVCHVVEGGKKCVAAASNDTAPALMTLGASLTFVSAEGTREIPIADLWVADGINNKSTRPGEILTEIRLPLRDGQHRGAYGKLRERGSIDFPLLGCAVRIDLDSTGAVQDAAVGLVALQARPLLLKGVGDLLNGHKPGTPEIETAIEAVALLAHKKCKPLDNIPGDKDYRRKMVPVYVRRTLRAALDESGPVHHI